MNIVKALFLTLLSITAFSVQSKQINTSNNSIEMKRVFNSNGTGQAGKGTTLSAVSASSATVTYTPPRPTYRERARHRGDRHRGFDRKFRKR